MKPQTVEILDHSSVETLLNDALHPAVTDWAQPNLVRHVRAETGAAYWGPGERMTFLATGEETGGAFFLAEIEVAPGGGTPPHIHHREDEAFHMLEGSLTIQVGGNTITASAGDFAFLPRGIAHSFKNTATAARRHWFLPRRRALKAFSLKSLILRQTDLRRLRARI